MPQYSYTPQADPDLDAQAAAQAPVSDALRGPAQFMDTFGRGTRDFARWYGNLAAGQPGADAVAPADPSAYAPTEAKLSPDQANAQYGGGGLIRFNAPVYAGDAAGQLAEARQQQVRNEVFGATNPSPLTDFGYRMAGGLLDPANLSLMFATGPVGEGAADLLGLRAASNGVLAASKIGRIANMAGDGGRMLAEGAVINAPYVAASGALTLAEGDDYDLGSALRDIAYGAVFHTSMGLLGKGFEAARARFGAQPPASGEFGAGLTDDEAAAEPVPPPAERAESGPYGDIATEFVPPSGVPDAVAALSPMARLGAFTKAADALADDQPVDVARYMARELGLDEDAAIAPVTLAPETGDLWRTPPEDLARMLDEGQLDDQAKLVRALGEDGAADFTRLDRLRNSSLPWIAEPASAEFDQKFAGLTAEQERLVYGVGETNAQVDEIREVLKAHGDLQEGDPEDWTSYVGAVGARGLTAEDMTAVREGRGSVRAQASFVRMGKAYEALSKAGVEPSDIPGRLAEGLVRQGGWRPEQAAEVIGGFVDHLRAAADKSPGRLMLEDLADRFRRRDGGQQELRAPGRAAEPVGPAPPMDLRAPEETAAGGREEGAPAAAAAQTSGDAIIAADPVLKALADDNDRWAAEHGVELDEKPGENPNAIVAAVRAAAQCLLGALDEIF